MNKVSDFFIKMNPVMTPILNSRFHSLFSSRLILLRFTGRKSAKQFVTPVGYTRFDDCTIITLTETHNRNWWRNYKEPWPLEIKHKGTWKKGIAVYVAPSSDDYSYWFERIFNKDKFMPKIFKIYDYDTKQGLQKEQLATLLENGSGVVKFSPDLAAK